MTAEPFPSDPLRLLAEDRFLRGLARGLLRDVQAADDVVQDAWLAAMARPPRAAGALRAWLRTVVRNLVANRRFSEIARQRREAAAARPEAVPSEDEVRAREALRREVVDHVLALPEPYRGAVLLRWFEDLPPRAIAARLGVPSTTVRTRLHRALEMLRARLDEGRDGDRRAWCLLLIPLARPQLAGAAAVLGGGALFAGSVVMKKVLVGVFAVLLLLSGAGVLWVLDVAGVRGAAQASPAPAVAGRNDLRSTTPEEVERSARRREIASAEIADAPAVRSGQLVLADGQPAGDVPWWFEPGRRLPPREGFLDNRGPYAAMRRHPVPGDAPRTTADGGLRLPVPGVAGSRPGEGVLWCEPTAGVRVGFPIDLPDKATDEPLLLRLPEFADFAVTCAGLGAEDRWMLSVCPAIQEPDDDWTFGHHLLRLLEVPDGRPGGRRLAVELDAHFLRRSGPGPVSIRVPAGVPYHLRADAEAFKIETEGAVHRAPAQVRLEAGAGLYTLPVEVLEADVRTATALGGNVLVSPRAQTWSHDQPLANGRATVGWCDWEEGTLCDLRVLMADGELFTDVFQVRGRAEQPTRQFVRGRGQPPQRVKFPPGPISLAGAKVVVEASDGKLLRPEREFSWLPGQPGGLVVVGPQELGLVAFTRDWRRLWALTAEGAVAVAEQEGREPSHGTWLPTELLGEFDLNAEFRARGGTGVAALFEIELPTGPGARSWQCVDSIQLRVGDDAVPPWRKRVPNGLRGRVRMVSLSGAFDDVLIPGR